MPYCLDSSQLVLTAAIISIYISNNKSNEETDLLGNLFTLIGANLLTISSSSGFDTSINDDSSKPKSDSNDDDDM